MTLEALRQTLRARRLPTAPETALQDAIALILMAGQVTFEREVQLAAGDRIDFLADDGTGIEVKVDGGLSEVTRQLHRYAQSERVSSLLLVTTRMRHLAVPRALNGKTIEVCHLIGSAL